MSDTTSREDSSLAPSESPSALVRAPLSADDAALHPLMKLSLRGYLEQKTSSRASRGLRIPLSAAQLQIKNPQLWPWAIAWGGTWSRDMSTG